MTETRDFILQFYVTLRRMVDGVVSYKNLMGPLGIFHAGTEFAYKGNDWLIWFLAMISANLAVVNFLPIPIVDGGLFMFLILEKIQGKPRHRNDAVDRPGRRPRAAAGRVPARDVPGHHADGQPVLTRCWHASLAQRRSPLLKCARYLIALHGDARQRMRFDPRSTASL